MSAEEMESLNAYLAERVLGWTWFKYTPKDSHDYQGCRTLADRPHRFLVKAKGDEPLAPDAFYNIPRPTTDPAAAMTVLEKCAEGESVSLSRAFHSNEQADLYTVRNGCLGDVYATAETLPLAICLFAKKIFSK